MTWSDIFLFSLFILQILLVSHALRGQISLKWMSVLLAISMAAALSSVFIGVHGANSFDVSIFHLIIKHAYYVFRY